MLLPVRPRALPCTRLSDETTASCVEGCCASACRDATDLSVARLWLPPSTVGFCLVQVSELSHKLGSAQGSAKSLEAEVAQLRSQVQQLGGEKHGLEMQLSDARAKLLAAQEKVRTQQPRLARARAVAVGRLPGWLCVCALCKGRRGCCCWRRWGH